MPTLHLTDWISWDKRSELPSSPGVYLIAKERPGKIIYIGRTWGDGGLRARVTTFNLAALNGEAKHSGGRTCHRIHGPQVDDLFVCTHVPKVITPEPAIMRPYIEYAERRLIWEYVERTGKLPACNSE